MYTDEYAFSAYILSKKNEYDQTTKDNSLSIHYSVKKNVGDSRVINMAVQNTARLYMKNLTINYDECCQTNQIGPGQYSYKKLR